MTGFAEETVRNWKLTPFDVDRLEESKEVQAGKESERTQTDLRLRSNPKSLTPNALSASMERSARLYLSQITWLYYVSISLITSTPFPSES